jgi:hypothetical protein
MLCRPVVLCVFYVIIETIRATRPANTFLESETMEKVNLVNEFGHGLCFLSTNKIANNSTNRLLDCRRNASGCSMIPLFFDVCMT